MDVFCILFLAIEKKIIRTHRCDIDKPRPRHRHKYTKSKSSLGMIAFTYIK